MRPSHPREGSVNRDHPSARFHFTVNDLPDKSVTHSIKVLQVYRRYYPDPPGGIAESIRQIALATAPHGITTRVFALSKQPLPATIAQPEGPVTRARSWMDPASCDIGGLAAFRRFAAEAAWADVVHYHYPWPFADLLRFTGGRERPSIMTYQSDIVRQRYLGQLYAPLRQSMLRSMRVIVATSPNYARTSPVLNDAAIRGRVEIIPPGIAEPTRDQDTSPNVASLIARFGLDVGKPYFLSVGAYRNYKGFEILAEAARQVDAPVVLAGEGIEDAMRASLKTTLPPNLVFTGLVDAPTRDALMKHCRGFVMASNLRSEAFGLVLIEAAMASRPLISCEIGTGTTFVNCDQETGLAVPPDDPAALAKAMTALLTDAHLADRYGRAARARYEALFSAPALGTAYADLYRRVCDSQLVAKAHSG